MAPKSQPGGATNQTSQTVPVTVGLSKDSSAGACDGLMDADGVKRSTAPRTADVVSCGRRHSTRQKTSPVAHRTPRGRLEVRSLNVTWRRDFWCNRVIVFFFGGGECVKLLAEQLWQFWRRYAPPFFRYLRKTWGADNRPPPTVRGRGLHRPDIATDGYIPWLSGGPAEKNL